MKGPRLVPLGSMNNRPWKFSTVLLYVCVYVYRVPIRDVRKYSFPLRGGREGLAPFTWHEKFRFVPVYLGWNLNTR